MNPFLRVLLFALFCSWPVLVQAHIPLVSVSSAEKSVPHVAMDTDEPSIENSLGTKQTGECVICLGDEEGITPGLFHTDMILSEAAGVPWVRLPCGHVFHQKCITRWFQERIEQSFQQMIHHISTFNPPTCPTCRNLISLTVAQIHTNLQAAAVQARHYVALARLHLATARDGLPRFAAPSAVALASVQEAEHTLQYALNNRDLVENYLSMFATELQLRNPVPERVSTCCLLSILTLLLVIHLLARM